MRGPVGRLRVVVGRVGHRGRGGARGRPGRWLPRRGRGGSRCRGGCGGRCGSRSRCGRLRCRCGRWGRGRRWLGGGRRLRLRWLLRRCRRGVGSGCRRTRRLGGGGVGVGGGGGSGFGHGGNVGQLGLPATATASAPLGPTEAYAQASASATPAVGPMSAHVNVSRANTRMAEADWGDSGRCTTEIMRPAAPSHARARRDWSEGGTKDRPMFEFRALARPVGGTSVRSGAGVVTASEKKYAGRLNTTPAPVRTHGRAAAQQGAATPF